MPEFQAPRFERRLTTLAFADIASYSRLIGTDEKTTVERWERVRSEILLPLLAAHRGRIAQFAGDALLIEFKSVIDAITWALDFQRATARRYSLADPMALRFRIAINIEDVIVEDDKIQGDGVNIAARIHQVAEPGQVVVTGLVRELVGNRAHAYFTDLGAHELKNIERPVAVFAVQPIDDHSVGPLHSPHLEWSSRPTLAVMPFLTLDEPERSNYFGQGITEDIISGLSTLRRSVSPSMSSASLASPMTGRHCEQR